MNIKPTKITIFMIFFFFCIVILVNNGARKNHTKHLITNIPSLNDDQMVDQNLDKIISELNEVLLSLENTPSSIFDKTLLVGKERDLIILPNKIILFLLQEKFQWREKSGYRLIAFSKNLIINSASLRFVIKAYNFKIPEWHIADNSDLVIDEPLSITEFLRLYGIKNTRFTFEFNYQTYLSIYDL